MSNSGSGREAARARQVRPTTAWNPDGVRIEVHDPGLRFQLANVGLHYEYQDEAFYFAEVQVMLGDVELARWEIQPRVDLNDHLTRDDQINEVIRQGTQSVAERVQALLRMVDAVRSI